MATPSSVPPSSDNDLITKCDAWQKFVNLRPENFPDTKTFADRFSAWISVLQSHGLDLPAEAIAFQYVAAIESKYPDYAALLRLSLARGDVPKLAQMNKWLVIYDTMAPEKSANLEAINLGVSVCE